jgi:Na+/proline symporter
LAYAIYRLFILDYSLVSIGLVAFVVLAQLAPSFFGAIFWRRGSKNGASPESFSDLLFVLYTLIPYATGTNSVSLLLPGTLGNFLKPFQLFDWII